MNEKKKWKERFIGKQVIKPHQAKKDVNLWHKKKLSKIIM